MFLCVGICPKIVVSGWNPMKKREAAEKDKGKRAAESCLHRQTLRPRGTTPGGGVVQSALCAGTGNLVPSCGLLAFSLLVCGQSLSLSGAGSLICTGMRPW